MLFHTLSESDSAPNDAGGVRDGSWSRAAGAGLMKGPRMQSKRELLTTVYAAFNRRDIDGVLALMRPNVDWPNGMEGGRLHGCDEVRAYWMRLWGILDPHVEPVRLKDDATGNTVVDVHQVIRDLSGSILRDQIVQHVYTFRDGLIERMDIPNLTEPTRES